MKKIIYSLVVIATLFSCKKENDIKIELVKIGSGNLYAMENVSEGYCTFKNEKDWNQFLEKFDSENNESINFTEKKIDFDQYMVVVGMDKIQPSVGYGIDFSSIETFEKTVEITALKTDPDNGILALIMTQPYVVAKINKTDREIIFK